MTTFKSFIKHFEAPQKSTKINFKLIFSLRPGSGWEGLIFGFGSSYGTCHCFESYLLLRQDKNWLGFDVDLKSTRYSLHCDCAYAFYQIEVFPRLNSNITRFICHFVREGTLLTNLKIVERFLDLVT